MTAYAAILFERTRLLVSVSMAVVDDALRLSRSGDVEGAIALLRADPVTHATLLFQLLTKNGVCDEAIELAGRALDDAKQPIARSTWALRRGLAYVERGKRNEAVKDLQLVLKLKANDGHVEQARVALLRAAELPK